MKFAKWFTVGATLSLLAVPALASDASADREALAGSSARGAAIHPVYAARAAAPDASTKETPRAHACGCCGHAE